MERLGISQSEKILFLLMSQREIYKYRVGFVFVFCAILKDFSISKRQLSLKRKKSEFADVFTQMSGSFSTTCQAWLGLILITRVHMGG